MVSEECPTTDSDIKDTRKTLVVAILHVHLKICDKQTRLGVTGGPSQTHLIDC